MLAFTFEAGVPFTNNEAEGALGPAKIKQKVSGGFFATLRKQKRNVVEQLVSVLQGRFRWAT